MAHWFTRKGWRGVPVFEERASRPSGCTSECEKRQQPQGEFSRDFPFRGVGGSTLTLGVIPWAAPALSGNSYGAAGYFLPTDRERLISRNSPHRTDFPWHIYEIALACIVSTA